VKSEPVTYQTIDEYIATFPTEIQQKLQEMRATIKAAAPEAQEKISYQMPTFYLHGNLVHFAAFKNHIGFFPGAIENISQAFSSEISKYMTGKGTLQFPEREALPLDLVSRIVKYRAAQNLEKAEAKRSKKKKA
jgi:uncharacterized protein YdhG (YjbR/CyaY superfamily)